MAENIPGVDYAFPPRPEISTLAAAGFKFACRYGGPGTRDKWLDPQEARDLSAAGISIVANAEGSATGLGNGWAVGVSWAKSAQSWFAQCGMPPDRPIYFSADFDVTTDDWPAVADALKGAASIIGADRVGVYGGYNPIRWAARDGVARWFWQTYAWSAGRWAPGNHIEQYRNGVTIAGADCDLNRAMQTDYGQWALGQPTKRSIDMLLGKVKGVATVYVGTGVESRPLDSYSDDSPADAAAVAEAFDVLKAKLGEPIEFSSLEALEATLGKVGGTPVPAEVDAAALAAELAPLMPPPPAYTATPVTPVSDTAP